MIKHLLLILLAIFSSIDAIDESGSSSASKRRRLSSEHPSENQYTCDHPYCEKTFARRDTLKKHWSINTLPASADR